jgi:hypothetical protein
VVVGGACEGCGLTRVEDDAPDLGVAVVSLARCNPAEFVQTRSGVRERPKRQHELARVQVSVPQVGISEQSLQRGVCAFAQFVLGDQAGIEQREVFLVCELYRESERERKRAHYEANCERILKRHRARRAANRERA